MTTLTTLKKVLLSLLVALGLAVGGSGYALAADAGHPSSDTHGPDIVVQGEDDDDDYRPVEEGY